MRRLAAGSGVEIHQIKDAVTESPLWLLKEALRGSNYDYVLIDCPSSPAEPNIGCAARLPDAIAVFFRMGRATIQTAARQMDMLARAHRTARRPYRGPCAKQCRLALDRPHARQPGTC